MLCRSVIAVLAGLFLTLGLATAGCPISRAVRAVMRDRPDSVGVIVRIVPGKKAPASFPREARARSLSLLHAVAGRLSASQIEELAASPDVQAIFRDAPVEDEFGPGFMPVESSPSILEDEENDQLTWGLKKIEAHRAWAELGMTGKGVRVGVVDSGVDASHEALRGRVVLFRDFVEGAADPVDRQGHGTHVAATIAGRVVSNGVRVGVAPDAQVLAAAVWDAASGGPLSRVLGALEYLADPDGDPATDDGARVINCSMGGFDADADAAMTECIERLARRNVVVVCSAGNDGDAGPGHIACPAALSCSLTVGAVTPELARNYLSSYDPPHLGDHPRGYLKPDLMAPGSEVLSAAPGQAFARKSGTSMAAPHVTGAIALMLQANPGLTPGEVREILEDTALGLGDRTRGSEYGAGLINVRLAVKRALELRDDPGKPVSIAGLLASGDEAVRKNNLPRAVDRFMRVIHLCGRDLAGETAQRAMFSLGSAYLQQWNHQAAIDCFTKQIELAPAGPWAQQAQIELAKARRQNVAVDGADAACAAP